MNRLDENSHVLLFVGPEDETTLPFIDAAQAIYQVAVCPDAGPGQTLPSADLIVVHAAAQDGNDALDHVRQLRDEHGFLDMPMIVMAPCHADLAYTALFESGVRDIINKPVQLPLAMARLRTQMELLFFRRLLHRETHLDPITGVLNRHSLDDHLRREWSRARRNRKPVSLVFICLDYLDSFGALYGREPLADCLRLVAAGLQSIVKRPADFVARYEDNTFVTLLPETDADAACQIAEALRRKVEALEIKNNHAQAEAGKITATLGVATGIPQEDNSDPDKLVVLGRQALVDAQALGRNCIASFIMPHNGDAGKSAAV